MSIPAIRPRFDFEERIAVAEVLDGGRLEGAGPLGSAFERRLEAALGARRVLLTNSCTAALEMAVMSLWIGSGDEVILPSFGFVTAATAVTRAGARPVFAEIREDTYNLDMADVAQRITSRTRAILCVHYAGQGCDMDTLQTLAEPAHLGIIEDAAQAIGARFNGRYLGTIGDVGCVSFHITKNITCGEGGAFITGDPAIARRAEVMRDKGTNRSDFINGKVDRYSWVDEGSSYGLSDLLASIIAAQFDRLPEINVMRGLLWLGYQERLADLEQRGHIHLPVIDPRAVCNWHIYAFRLADRARRSEVLESIRRRDVMASSHFVPLHSSPYAQQRWGYRADDLPVTERVAASIIRLPIWAGMTDDMLDYVSDVVHEAIG
jgi:dTDP-4-amino-4,6-dideoxygalactose transaminase